MNFEELRPVIISAPFGNYHKLLNFEGVTHTVGTFTASPRSWKDKPKGNRWWRVVASVRYSPSLKGWKNRIGLKNPGIDQYVHKIENKKIYASDKILSIYGFDQTDWDHLFSKISIIKPLAVEINASCPNVGKLPFSANVMRQAVSCHENVIVKIPPVFYEPIVRMAWDAGIKCFHCCNSLPTPCGGVSGKPVLQVSQGVVSWLRKQYPDAFIIGGGGITSSDDAAEYIACGANRVAVGSMLFNVFNWFKIRKIVYTADRNDVINELLT